MPTYQYSCTECGNFFEAVQSFSEDSLTVCPECDGKLRKVFNAVGVVFKGSGFYRNDSRGSTSSATPATSSENGSSTPAAPAAESTSKKPESSTSSTASAPAPA
ncbi:MAG: type antifreeze protein [Marmoricola sp.]|nr:type antifreeze protein [Marmoricola sp.]